MNQQQILETVTKAYNMLDDLLEELGLLEDKIKKIQRLIEDVPQQVGEIDTNETEEK